jgi:hypothetical protein
MRRYRDMAASIVAVAQPLELVQPQPAPWWRRSVALPILLGLLASALAAFVVVRGTHDVRGATVDGHGFVRNFDHPTRPLDILLGRGDGQAFAQLARDPSLRHPEEWVLGSTDAAYRAQRPLLGYAAWAVALGDRDRVPPALAALAIAGCGLAVTGCALLLSRRRMGALLIVLAPGFLISAVWFTPEMLGLGLAALGVLAYRRDRWVLAVVLLSCAGLARESFLLVCAGLALHELSRRRLPRPLLAAPAAVWAGWSVFVHLRFGRPVWPLTAADDMTLPLKGLFHAIPMWREPFDSVFFALTALSILALVLLRPRSEIAWIAACYGVLALILGPAIWAHWYNFGRLLLPLHAFALLAVLDDERPSEHARSGLAPYGHREMARIDAGSASSSR